MRALLLTLLLLPLLAAAQYTGGQGRGDVMVAFAPPALFDCPLSGSNVGDPCDDGDPNTVNDTVQPDCTCAGTPSGGPCVNDLFFVYSVGNNPQDVTWSLFQSGSNALLQSGGVPFSGNGSLGTCLPDGKFYLRVTDAGGDGIAGGYRLITADGRRIIDNTDNFLSGGLSTIANDGEFELPLGPDKPIYTSCDKTWWKSGEFLVASENSAVSGMWTPGPNRFQDPTSGYEFWFYAPNGGYSFRRFRGHHESDGYANVGATRACHVRLNNWAAANHLPEGILLNVKVRGVVAGVPQNWGEACRFTLDNALANCPPSKLMDIPFHPQLSCGQTRTWARGQRVYARTVRGATHYQWRFRIIGENFTRVVTTNTHNLHLWTVPGLQAGKTYEVEVRVSKNGTVSWCGLGSQNPDILSPKWGDVCLLTLAPAMMGPDGQGIADDQGGLRMWPNPNRGDQLWIDLDGIAAGVETVTVDLFDLSGKRILARVLPTQGDKLSTVMELNGDLAAGTYLVRIVAGGRVWVERLVLCP